MLVECAVSLTAAYQARSVSVLAFGADSVVELLSATAVLLQFGGRVRLSREKSAKTAGVLLLMLAGVVAVLAVAGWFLRVAPEPSRRGLGITAAALVAMPVLAWFKRRVARETHDRALAADAVQSATCAYLAAATLVSLALQIWFPLRWIDSIAALAVLPLLISEGRKALQGDTCGCC